MESAKNAVKGFLHNHGKKETDVETTTAPAVTNETVKKTNENQVTTAVDREVHQDHHHTTVQPIKDTEVKAQQHHHHVAPTEHRHIEHDNAKDVEGRLAAERAQFQDTTKRVDGGSTTVAAPNVTGEHVHHHVHETIQPVIQKETLEEHITHHTIPVHEVHHNATKHHGTSVLPAVSRQEFESGGASLTGGKAQRSTFEGEPRLVHDTTGGPQTRSQTGVRE